VASVSPEALGTISILQPIPSSQAYNVAQCYQPQLLAQVCMEPAISKMYSTYTFNFKQQSSTTAAAKHKHNTTHTHTPCNSVWKRLALAGFAKAFCTGKGFPGLGKG